MTRHFIAASLVLVASTHFQIFAASTGQQFSSSHARNFNSYAQDDLATAFAESDTTCQEVNGTHFTTGYSIWTLLCDIDFTGQNISPFLLAKSYETCMKYCEDYNDNHGPSSCAGFVWAPNRSDTDNDCYLKSSLNDAVYPATISLIGASLASFSLLHATVSPAPKIQTSFSPTLNEIIVTPSAIPTPNPSYTSSISPSVPDADIGTIETKGVIPYVKRSTYLGVSVNVPTSQYVKHALAKPSQLAEDLLVAGINIDLINDYPLASDTGSWTSQDASEFPITDMTVTPRFSRDGGRGGNVNGTNVFIFCDTSTYGASQDAVLGYLNGFVSSSIAVDESMNGLNDEALNLTNSLGQWQDDVGRMRGWVPMTTGEEAFNQAISGQGYRYAVWPNSNPIPLNATHSIMYAPLVYLEVDMQDQSSPSYTSLGNTLLLISVDPVYGPHADRLSNQFFTEKDVNWGSLGGVRAWFKTGRDSDEGEIYVFGQAENGILLGRVNAQEFSSRNKYHYWNGASWSADMPPTNSAADALMIEQPVMNMDLFYSPVHRTFIMIYLTPEADNTFYYRYLISKDNSTLEIVPAYEQGGSENYVENLITNDWSEQKILFTVPTPERGYAYAGGMHSGYFGDDDVTNGGSKMLVTWTEHTNIDPNDPASGYAHKSQVIELGSEVNA